MVKNLYNCVRLIKQDYIYKDINCNTKNSYKKLLFRPGAKLLNQAKKERE